ncbi:MAG: carbohydrate ABC transporter permease [Thermomicrobia bacterium]|nr:carbohydrate ABC transporter permease [Thermomicrobia bacterium]
MAIAARTRTQSEEGARTRRLQRSGVRTLVMVVGLGIFTIWTLMPFFWIIETSVKTNRDLYQEATLFPKHITGVHYGEVLHKTKFLTYIKNSLSVSVGTTVIAMVIGVLSAYAMTRLSFRGRTFMARSIIVTYLVPGALLFIPILQIALQLHITNKAWGLILIYLIFTVPFCTWLAISYFNTIPVELEDAALIDGATRLQSLVRVIIPLALPALAVIALFAFTNSWNEFFFALLLVTKDSQKTIPVGLSGLINGDTFQWGALMAMSLLSSLPPVLIYIIAQKWVVSGLSGGAVKG